MTSGRLGRRLAGAALGVLIAAHFALAGISAANVPLSRAFGVNAYSRAALLYAYLSGTGNCFGFFAPGVVSQLQVAYDVRRAGVAIGSGVIGSANPETSLRLHNLTQQFWTASKKPEVRRSFAASVAGRIFSEMPQADEVLITLRTYALPSMVEYRAGRRPAWETNYVGTFRRDSGA